MDLTGLIALGAFWFLINLLGRARGKEDRPGPMPTPPRGGGDPTQREGSQLEMLFREVERRLEEATPRRGPMRRPTGALPPVEERGSLEVEPEVASLEGPANRPARQRVDRDDEVERIEAARIAAAEARSGPLSKADHIAFDARLRQQPADATAVRPLSPERLREAVVWREILGPPASLREDR